MCILIHTTFSICEHSECLWLKCKHVARAANPCGGSRKFGYSRDEFCKPCTKAFLPYDLAQAGVKERYMSYKESRGWHGAVDWNLFPRRVLFDYDLAVVPAGRKTPSRRRRVGYFKGVVIESQGALGLGQCQSGGPARGPPDVLRMPTIAEGRQNDVSERLGGLDQTIRMIDGLIQEYESWSVSGG